MSVEQSICSRPVGRVHLRIPDSATFPAQYCCCKAERETDSSFTLSGELELNLWQIRHIPNMKHKPQTLTLFTSAVVLAILAGGMPATPISVAAVLVADETAAADQETPGAALQRSEMTAAQVFQAVADKLDEVTSLSCEIRQTILMSGQRFVAIGDYKQSSGNRMRLEYRIYPVRAQTKSDPQVDAVANKEDEQKHTGSLLQVSDGSVLWSYWVNGDTKKLSRRNIAEIVDAAEKVESYSAARTLQDLGVGGLQTLTSQLQVGMDFGAVQEQKIGDSDLYVLTGRWNEKTLKDVFQAPDPAKAVLPDYIPDYVRIYVDASAMLPRRIQYLKKHPDPQQKKIRNLVTLDLKNIDLQVELPDSTFVFPRPDDKEVKEVDLTAQVIKAIENMAADKEKSAVEGEGSAAGADKPDPTDSEKKQPE